MQAQFDTASAAQAFSGVTGITWFHTASGSNRYVRVHFGVAGSTPPAITVITYGGAAMTLVGQSVNTPAGSRAAIYELINPPTGSQTVAVTFDQAAYGSAGSVSTYDTDQTSPSGTVFTASGTSVSSTSVTVTDATSDDLITDIVKVWSSGGTQPTVGADQNQNFKGQDGSFNEYAASSRQAGTAGGVMSWTFAIGNSEFYGHAAARIKGYPAGFVLHPIRRYGAGRYFGRRPSRSGT